MQPHPLVLSHLAQWPLLPAPCDIRPLQYWAAAHVVRTPPHDGAALVGARVVAPLCLPLVVGPCVVGAAVDGDGARVLLDLDRDGDRVPFDVLFLHVPHDEGQFCFTSVV